MASYKDIDFSFSKNSFTGDLNTVNDVNAIKQSVKNIILTLRGEKSFSYNFGAAVQRLLFEQSTENNVAVATEIQNSLSQYEPRIDVVEVNFTGVNEEFRLNIVYETILPNGQSVTDTASIDTQSSGY